MAVAVLVNLCLQNDLWRADLCKRIHACMSVSSVISAQEPLKLILKIRGAQCSAWKNLLYQLSLQLRGS